MRPRFAAAALTCRVDQRDQPVRLDDLRNTLPLSSRQVDARGVVGARVQPGESHGGRCRNSAGQVGVVEAGEG